MKPLLVAKVGGSLFDQPDLRARLRSFISQHEGNRIVFVPGGGEGADVIRKLDQLHGIGEERSHWIALRILAVNAAFLGTLLQARVVSQAPVSEEISILDPCAFCEIDEASESRLEHSWRITSDSIAARVARVEGGHVALLKSTDLPAGMGWRAAAQAGLVDAAFPELVERAKLEVTWINLRSAKFSDSR